MLSGLCHLVLRGFEWENSKWHWYQPCVSVRTVGSKHPVPLLAAHNNHYQFRALTDVDERFESLLLKLSATVHVSPCCDNLLHYLPSLQVYTSCSQNLGMTPCCAISSHFLAFTSCHTRFQRLIHKYLRQRLPAILRNFTAYQHSSNATFYRCIGHCCTMALQFRKYNRLSVHVSVSRCGGSMSKWRVYKRELCCLDR